MINTARSHDGVAGRARKPRHVRVPGELALAQEARRDEVGQPRERITTCVEINQCVGCTRQLFTKSFLGDDVAALAPSSGEEPTLPRHRAGVASMAWRTTRRFSTNAP